MLSAGRFDAHVYEAVNNPTGGTLTLETLEELLLTVRRLPSATPFFGLGLEGVSNPPALELRDDRSSREQ